MHTNGYGDRPISKSVEVFTNDPKRPKFDLTVSGKVDLFADIKPARVSLKGKAGETMREVVRIGPRERYPFTIRQARASRGDYFHVTLDPHPTDASYRLIVENKIKIPGTYFDRIEVTTDSPVNPQFTIQVQCKILEGEGT